MTLQLEGQLDLFDMLPLVCQHCGQVGDLDRPYDIHHFPRPMPRVNREFVRRWLGRGMGIGKRSGR